MVAEVIINRSAKKLNKTFDYNIPKELEELITIGSKVIIPFGNSKKLEEGYVIAIKEKSEYKVKDIIKLENNLTDFQIRLAKWMSKKYFCNVSDCIKLMQTPGTAKRENKVQDKIINTIYLKKEAEEIEFEIETGKIKSDKHKKIIKFVKDNEGCTIPEIEMFTDCSRAIVNTLIKNNYLEIVEKKIERNPLIDKKIKKSQNLKLTLEQEEAYKKVLDSIEKKEFKEYLLYGVTGSRQNRSIFTTYTKSNRKRKNSDSISTRNIFNSTNARQVYLKIWKRSNSSIT